MRQSKFLDIEDFLFLFRNDPVRITLITLETICYKLVLLCSNQVIVRRLLDFLRFKKSLKNIKAEAESSNAESSTTEDTELLLNSNITARKRAPDSTIRIPN